MNTNYNVSNIIDNQLPGKIYMAYGMNKMEVVFTTASSHYRAIKEFKESYPDASMHGIITYSKD